MLYCPLRSACTVYTLCFALPYELDVVWLFFTFILVELRNKWILTFWIIICFLSTQKCQCSAANLTSVLGNMDSGIFVVLKIWMFLLRILCRICVWLLFAIIWNCSQCIWIFLSGNIIQDKSNSVHRLGKCFFWMCFW